MTLSRHDPLGGGRRAPGGRALRLLLGAVAGLFAMAAIYTSVLIVERQEALQQVARYNTA